MRQAAKRTARRSCNFTKGWPLPVLDLSSIFVQLFLIRLVLGYNSQGSIRLYWMAMHRSNQNSMNWLNLMIKNIVFFSIYTALCVFALYQALQETTAQPIGLLVVGMVLTPLLLSIIGGLSLDILNFKKTKSWEQRQVVINLIYFSKVRRDKVKYNLKKTATETNSNAQNSNHFWIWLILELLFHTIKN